MYRVHCTIITETGSKSVIVHHNVKSKSIFTQLLFGTGGVKTHVTRSLEFSPVARYKVTMLSEDNEELNGD